MQINVQTVAWCGGFVTLAMMKDTRECVWQESNALRVNKQYKCFVAWALKTGRKRNLKKIKKKGAYKKHYYDYMKEI